MRRRRERRTRRQRGATLTGYSLTVATFAAVSLGALQTLEDNSGEFLTDTGDQIGTPRGERAYVVTSILAPPTTVPPTPAPTPPPTSAPTTAPTSAPTSSPTSAPTTAPTSAPTSAPTTTPAPPMSQTIGDAVLSGPWTVNGDGSVTSSRQGGNLTTPDYQETITFTFVAPADGQYMVFGTIMAPSGSDDSFWVDVSGSNGFVSSGTNGGSAYQWAPDESTSFVERQLNDGTSGNGDVTVAPFTFAAGETITVVVSNREDGTSIAGLELRQIS